MKTDSNANKLKTCRRNLFAAAVVAALTSAPFAGAWAVEFHNAAESAGIHGTGAAIEFTMERDEEQAMPVSDKCLSLLKTVNHVNGPVAAMPDRTRDAGHAAALGLIFGVKFALGPKESAQNKRSGRRSPKARFSVWQVDDQHETGSYKALAVSDYRRCRNEEALNFLSDWRWSR